MVVVPSPCIDTLTKEIMVLGDTESGDVDVEEQNDYGNNGLSSEYNTEPTDVFILVVCIIYACQRVSPTVVT